MFDRLTIALMRRLESAIGMMLALMVILVFGNVVHRYGFNSGITTSEEVSRYLFIWLTFIGAVIAMHERARLRADRADLDAGVDADRRRCRHRSGLFRRDVHHQ
jgi:TRAP-type C4-dicarboxylate transport system permease small subunit